MKRHVTLEKPVGATPLETVELFRNKHPELENKKLAYAGRLDPMASGKLLVLIGDTCKKQERYTSLDKEYTFEVLFGYTSDTGDVLGLVEEQSDVAVAKEQLDAIVQEYRGAISLQYPIFSSRTVHGKPLFLWALEDKLDEIEIPYAHTYIYKLICKNLYTIQKEILEQTIYKNIQSISQVVEDSKSLGRDFRRSEIEERWKKVCTAAKRNVFQIGVFSCVCSSGTYMRSLAGEIGKKLGVGGLAYSIHRETIGAYQCIGRYGFWRKKM